ncbi:MAG: hypothetical protein R3270_03895 [Gammaproteobacteria bacterium]|nr:hypothetical protein [Gammaproteobacteria bacterium]
MRTATLTAILLAGLAPIAVTQTVHAQQRQEAPCSRAEHRQFDFWLGSWDVYNPDGEKVGENRITLEQGQCVLHEHWQGAKGGTGESFNIYDARRDVWHQTWVAASGNLLLLEGGMEGESMVLSGTQPLPDGKTLHNRITWTPQDDGSVHQVWDQSTDGGETWKTGFHGIYRPKAD